MECYRFKNKYITSAINIIIFLTLLLVSSHLSASDIMIYQASPLSAYSAPDSLRPILVKWDANTESDLAGYKLYYGWSSGEYQYTSVVTANYIELTTDKYKTYYFAVTAFDSSGNESGYSNEVSLGALVIPECHDGDINKDLVVNEDDFFLIMSLYWTHNSTYDMNGDGVINEYEFFQVMADYWKVGYKVQ